MESRSEPVILGIVSNGKIWEFGRLGEMTFTNFSIQGIYESSTDDPVRAVKAGLESAEGGDRYRLIHPTTQPPSYLLSSYNG